MHFYSGRSAATLDDGLSVDDLIHLTLETGEYGVRGMALLDRANTETYGNPEITTVDIGVGSNPGILVSGHDLRDMEMLLEPDAGNRRRCIYALGDASGAVLSGISRNIRILRVITAMHGGVRRKSLRCSMDRS